MEDAPDTIATKYWHVLDDGRVQCNMCPCLCKLHEGQPGLCFARACQDGRIVLTTYGRSSGFCADPIEKKPVHLADWGRKRPARGRPNTGAIA